MQASAGALGAVWSDDYEQTPATAHSRANQRCPAKTSSPGALAVPRRHSPYWQTDRGRRRIAQASNSGTGIKSPISRWPRGGVRIARPGLRVASRAVRSDRRGNRALTPAKPAARDIAGRYLRVDGLGAVRAEHTTRLRSRLIDYLGRDRYLSVCARIPRVRHPETLAHSGETGVLWQQISGQSLQLGTDKTAKSPLLSVLSVPPGPRSIKSVAGHAQPRSATLWIMRFSSSP